MSKVITIPAPGEREHVPELVRLLLSNVKGEPWHVLKDDDSLKDTPGRVAAMLTDVLAFGEFKPEDDKVWLKEKIFHKTFTAGETELVLVSPVRVFTLCEHHALPFYGHAHVAYIPSGNRVIGLSKVARLVQFYSKRLQIQERLTNQVADAFWEVMYPRPLGAAVVLDCQHTCMMARGAREPEAWTSTQALRGVFKTDPATRAEFFSSVRRPKQ